MNSSEQLQPCGTVQRGRKPWRIWQGGSCHCNPRQHPQPDPPKEQSLREMCKRESKISVPPPSTPG